MNLEAPSWIADFRFSAALDTFFLVVVLDLGGWFFDFSTFSEFSGRVFFCSVCFLSIFSWAGLGVVLAYFVLPTPPLSDGAGLGNRATRLWHRTRSQSCRLGLGRSWRIPRFFLLVFGFHFLFSMKLPRLPPHCGWHGDGFPSPLRTRPSFLSRFFNVPCWLRFLAVQRGGSGL